MRNASGHQGENKQQWKKIEKEHMRHFKKHVIRKFLEVSRCSHALKRQRIVPKNVLHVQSTNNSYLYV